MYNLTVATAHTYFVGEGPWLVHNASCSAPKGGTYTLKDPETGQVMRTGRTNDLNRRMLEHRNAPETRGLDFEVSSRTDDKAVQRGLEQMLYEKHQAPLNKIRPISLRNPRYQYYMDAARRFLER